MALGLSGLCLRPSSCGAGAGAPMRHLQPILAVEPERAWQYSVLLCAAELIPYAWRRPCSTWAPDEHSARSSCAIWRRGSIVWLTRQPTVCSARWVGRCPSRERAQSRWGLDRCPRSKSFCEESSSTGKTRGIQRAPIMTRPWRSIRPSLCRSAVWHGWVIVKEHFARLQDRLHRLLEGTAHAPLDPA